MAATVTIRDEEMTGKTISEFSLDFLTEHITVRELIRGRVYQEVKDHNGKKNQTEFRGLVQPTDAERTLNGYRLRKPRRIDWKEQFEKASEAFENNGFFILIDNKQAEHLDEEYSVSPSTEVSFVKLTLLVGGECLSPPMIRRLTRRFTQIYSSPPQI